MNCYKCGKEMRVVPEQVATDEKGLPVYHRIGYCDSCMSKFDIDILEQQKIRQFRTIKSRLRKSRAH